MAVTSGFPMPRRVELDEATATPTYGKFTAAPFQSGFGHTIGNSLRRVLLSSLEGAAISAVRVEGATHEFMSVPNIIEDMTEVVLNLKKVRLVCHGETPKILEIRRDKAGEVTGADIITDGTVEVLNKDQVICTLDKDGEFRAEVEIITGRGYRPAERNKRSDHPLGTIPIDCLFSPVARVRYEVGAARVGEETEMDALSLEIWTDGRISPNEALEKSTKILQEHLRPFLGKEAGQDDALAMINEDEKAMFKVLIQEVDSLDLSVRSQNCLDNANIRFLGELCCKTESRMLKYKNFGKKSLEEIVEKLEGLGLGLGMQFSEALMNAVEAEIERLQAEDEENEKE